MGKNRGVTFKVMPDRLAGEEPADFDQSGHGAAMREGPRRFRFVEEVSVKSHRKTECSSLHDSGNQLDRVNLLFMAKRQISENMMIGPMMLSRSIKC